MLIHLYHIISLIERGELGTNLATISDNLAKLILKTSCFTSSLPCSFLIWSLFKLWSTSHSLFSSLCRRTTVYFMKVHVFLPRGFTCWFISFSDKYRVGQLKAYLLILSLRPPDVFVIWIILINILQETKINTQRRLICTVRLLVDPQIILTQLLQKWTMRNFGVSHNYITLYFADF